MTVHYYYNAGLKAGREKRRERMTIEDDLLYWPDEDHPVNCYMFWRENLLIIIEEKPDQGVKNLGAVLCDPPQLDQYWRTVWQWPSTVITKRNDIGRYEGRSWYRRKRNLRKKVVINVCQWWRKPESQANARPENPENVEITDTRKPVVEVDNY